MKNKKQWVNHKGEIVPEKYVSGYDKKKEKVLLKLLSSSEKLSNLLHAHKAEIFKETDNLIELMYKEHNSSRPEDYKGNYTIFSFDKQIRLTIKVSEVIDFDDKIKIAQDKINKFLEEKTKGADQDLSLLVNNAFKTSKGRLDKNRVLGLFSLKINHPLWNEAMELIKSSITTNHTKRYATVAKRDKEGNYKDIMLNISSI
jgi:hypothetical protein